MPYLLDTNILIHLIRDDAVGKICEHLIKNQLKPVISVISIGELKSIAMQRRWSNYRLSLIEELAVRFLVADIHTEEIVNRYAEIDAFSQGKHPTLSLKTSARNMGKNDLWIAATASVYDLTLLTTDNDFSHIGDSFLDLQVVTLTT